MDIVVLGCGISGMLNGLALEKYGYNVTILEKNNLSNIEHNIHKYDNVRTTALNLNSRSFFQSIDIWNEIQSCSGPINDIYVVYNKSPKLIDLLKDYSKSDEENKSVGYIIQNTNLRKILFDKIKKKKLIKIIDDISKIDISNDNEKCIINAKFIDSNKKDIKYFSDLCLVCDGKNSGFSERFFSYDTKINYKQTALTFIISHTKQHEGTAMEHFVSSSVFATLPMADQNESSIVWSIDNDRINAIKEIAETDKKRFLELIKENLGEFLGEIKIETEQQYFPLTAYNFKKYVNKRLAVIGDTAHILHPLAGQGLNQAIRDIENLNESLNKYESNIDNALNNYQKISVEDNKIMLELITAINYLFTTKQNNFQNILLKNTFGLIEKSTYIKRKILNYGIGIH